MGANTTNDPITFGEIWELLSTEDRELIAEVMRVDVGALALYKVSGLTKANQIATRNSLNGLWAIIHVDELRRTIKRAVRRKFGTPKDPLWVSTFQNRKHPKPQNERLRGKYAKHR
jgi:hypothetical protein